MALFSVLLPFHPYIWSAAIAYLDKAFVLYANALLAALGIGLMSATAIPDELMTTYLNTGAATLAYNYAP
jgi:hypothetical protein